MIKDSFLKKVKRKKDALYTEKKFLGYFLLFITELPLVVEIY